MFPADGLLAANSSLPDWDAGSPTPPPIPQRLTRVCTKRRIHASRGRVGLSEASCWLRQADLRKTGLPRPWVASSFWLFGVKITVCSLNSSWPQELCREGLSFCGFLVPSTGRSRRYQEHQRGEDNVAPRAGGSRWLLTHCPVHEANQQRDTDQGDGGHKSCTRAAREIRQEQPKGPKALSFRKLCFDFLRKEFAGRRGKGQVWVPVLIGWSKRNVK